MLAVAGAALDIDMDTPHTDETYTDEEDNGATPHGNAGARHPNRAGNEKRDRDQALRRLSQYSDGVFRRRFKLTRKRFWSLLDVLRPDLELDDLGQRKARNSSGSPVPPECKLAVTLRRAGKDGVYLDNFNFYQSRIRINIECAFGLLVAKFGILRRAMTGTMEHNTAVVNACIHLHNMGVDDNMPFSAPLSRDIVIGDRLKPLRQDQVTVAPRSMRKHPKTSMRDRLTQHLRDLGRARPTYQRQTRGVAKK
eukprot:jgi/Tetstr1/466752/TSEL_011222.t2